MKDLDAKNLKWSLGIVHFIGELFKLKMLSETVIHECLVRLLRSSSDTDSLECFARLLTVTGKDIDRPEAKVCECINPFHYGYCMLRERESSDKLCFDHIVF